jgi:hypothetical protein
VWFDRLTASPAEITRWPRSRRGPGLLSSHQLGMLLASHVRRRAGARRPRGRTDDASRRLSAWLAIASPRWLRHYDTVDRRRPRSVGT